MDSVLSRTDVGEYNNARQYVQLQNRYLTFQHQLNSRLKEPVEEEKQILTNQLEATPVQASAVVPAPTTVQAPAVGTVRMSVAGSVQEPLVVPAAIPVNSPTPLVPSSILTPPPTVEVPSAKRARKRPRI